MAEETSAPLIDFDQTLDLLKKFQSKIEQKAHLKLEVDPLHRKAVILREAEGASAAFLLKGGVKQEAFQGIMLSVAQNELSGELIFKSGDVQRSIFFEKGIIVFARSNQKDDRLGEVIYRKGFITVMELASTSVQVTKGKRFGGILVESGVFNHFKLFQAMRTQVEELVNSIFFMDNADVFFDETSHSRFIRLRLDKPTETFINTSAKKGLNISDFDKKTNEDSLFEVPDEINDTGLTDFDKEFISILRKNPTKKDILKASKLSHAYIMSVTHYLMTKRIVTCSDYDVFNTAAVTQEELNRKAHLTIDQKNSIFSVMHQFIKTKQPELVEQIDTFLKNDKNELLTRFGDLQFANTGVLAKANLLQGIQVGSKISTKALDALFHFLTEFQEFILFEVREFMPPKDAKEIEGLVVEMDKQNQQQQ